MVKRILVVVLFVLFSLKISAQEEYPHLLVFKDGTEIQGKVVVWNNNSLIFRDSSTGEKTSYKYKLIKGVNNFKTGTDYDGLYSLRQLKDTDKTLRLKKAVIGKMECFYIPRETSTGFGDGTVVSSTYYLGREGENEVVKIRGGIKFRKVRKVLFELFEDCPDVISKIEQDYFDNNIEALERVVRYYNTKC